MPDAPIENVPKLLRSRAADRSRKTLLIGQSEGRAFTYQEFEQSVNRTANLLVSLGVRKGARVGLFLANRVEYLVFYFACFEIGAWAGPINALLRAAEVEFLLQNSGALVVVTEPALLPVLSDASKSCGLRHIIVVGDQVAAGESSSPAALIGYDEVIANFPDELESVDISEDDEAVIIYTSGTTGKPKGVLLTHGNLLANAKQISEWLRLTEQDRSMIVMPLFHVNALMTTAMATIWAGGSIVLASRFSASRHWNVVSQYGVTYFGSVATMLSMLNNTYPEGLPDKAVVAGLRFALCGSAPVPVEIIKRFQELFSCPVIEGYGLTESTCRSTFNPVADRRQGSVGMPIGNEVKVFDDSDSELSAGQIGEIVLRGPNIMKGYYRNPEATEEAFRSGWFHTGDLGYRDRDGFFYIVDRKSEMIIRGGENIYPREIDEVLYQHPKVRDAATIGLPDPLYGEEVKSFVVLREEETATEGDLINFCLERLAPFKCPKSIEFVEDIPKGPTGKLLKRELLARVRSG